MSSVVRDVLNSLGPYIFRNGKMSTVEIPYNIIVRYTVYLKILTVLVISYSPLIGFQIYGVTL